MSSVFVASQSSSVEQIRLVENRLNSRFKMWASERQNVIEYLGILTLQDNSRGEALHFAV